MGTAECRSYLDLLKELSGCLDRLSALAQEKAESVRQDDLTALGDVLKQEQAMTLTLRGLDQRRMKLLGSLGLEDVPLAELHTHVPPELEDEARQAAENARRSYREYRSYADMARNTLELNLHQIEKVIAAAGVDTSGLGVGYTPPGVEPPQNMKTDFRA